MIWGYYAVSFASLHNLKGLLLFGGCIALLGTYFFIIMIYQLCGCLRGRFSLLTNICNVICCIHCDWCLSCWDKTLFGMFYYFTINLIFLLFYAASLSKQTTDGGVFGCIMHSCCMLFITRCACRLKQEELRPVHVYPTQITVVEVFVEDNRTTTVNGTLYTYECEWCAGQQEDCEKCTCAICYQSMHLGEVIQFQRCVHSFHNECWKQYQKIDCPVCRQV
jgi:hypothetical protein